MKYISENLNDRFASAGISVNEMLAENEGERDMVIFTARSPLDINDGYNNLLWEITVKSDRFLAPDQTRQQLNYMASQVYNQLFTFVIKDEVVKTENNFIKLSKKHPEIPIPKKKDILSEARQHKAFIKKVFDLLSDWRTS